MCVILCVSMKKLTILNLRGSNFDSCSLNLCSGYKNSGWPEKCTLHGDYQSRLEIIGQTSRGRSEILNSSKFEVDAWGPQRGSVIGEELEWEWDR